jgi:predicted nucleic acid-binding protein
MPPVIADTSPLQYLFQVGYFDLLPRLFETVQVPDAVRDELHVGRALGFDVPDPASYPWISIHSTTPSPALQRFELGAGEHAVLSLALETTEPLILLDDAAARAAANHLGVRTTGTLGTLLLSKERGLLTEVAPVLANLERRGFRLTDPVKQQVLRLAGE